MINIRELAKHSIRYGWIPFALITLFALAAVYLPSSKTTAIYLVLALTMWGVGLGYAHKYLKTFETLEAGTTLLIIGIAISFTGHAIDQTLWSGTSVADSVFGYPHGVEWVRRDAQLLIVTGKGLAILGALCHVRLLLIPYYPKATLDIIVLGWIAIWAFLTLLIA
tara:strand:+ start:1697 stop:2194 length:498 start_codon:yes stop_codon:yes gene_type:complete